MKYRGRETSGSADMELREHHCDLMVIGTGVAGMAAAVFAVERGLSVVMAGSVGGIDYTTGYLDLLGVHPVQERRRCRDPWLGLRVLARDCPDHPYSRLGPERIRSAMDEFTRCMAEIGLPFEGRSHSNVAALTAIGTAKLTYRVPRTMWKGVLALERKERCLIVGFTGLKGFSSRQIVEVQKNDWPGLRHVTLAFPGFRGELYPEHLAWALSEPDRVRELAAAVRPHVRDAVSVGFPAVLGPAPGPDVAGMLEEQLDSAVFEIPTLPPSLPGLRMRGVLESWLEGKGVTVLSQKMALSGQGATSGKLRIHIGSERPERLVHAGAVIHAGGRFFGKGLRSDRKRIFEPVFDLPVAQPETRSLWHDPDFFTPKGHAANRAGLECDDQFRPLGRDGLPRHERLFAAGSILAHQDWMRAKCGAGLSIATAHAAVAALAETGG